MPKQEIEIHFPPDEHHYLWPLMQETIRDIKAAFDCSETFPATLTVETDNE